MRTIKLSKLASKKLDLLLEYLEKDWSVKVKSDFIRKLDKSLNQIRKFPESTEKSEIKKDLHKCVITKQTSLYYKYDDKSIKVVTIFDNRMNLKKLINEVK
jgi:plasmid stabilization system protein ParE